ncbi:unknown [Prevotella sp. CAG:485]|nr:unknown [Prevotella sp. CAG:485]
MLLFACRRRSGLPLLHGQFLLLAAFLSKAFLLGFLLLGGDAALFGLLAFGGKAFLLGLALGCRYQRGCLTVESAYLLALFAYQFLQPSVIAAQLCRHILQTRLVGTHLLLLMLLLSQGHALRFVSGCELPVAVVEALQLAADGFGALMPPLRNAAHITQPGHALMKILGTQQKGQSVGMSPVKTHLLYLAQIGAAQGLQFLVALSYLLFQPLTCGGELIAQHCEAVDGFLP